MVIWANYPELAKVVKLDVVGFLNINASFHTHVSMVPSEVRMLSQVIFTTMMADQLPGYGAVELRGAHKLLA